jgi:hypothetical protein
VNHKDANQTVFITKSETKQIKLEPSPIMGSVSVFTKPETETKGAEIFMNETKINKTSPAVFPYIIGTYLLTVKKNGFDETTQQIKVSEGQNTKIEVKMTNQKFMVQRKISRNRIFEVSWLVAGAAIAGTGAYLYIDANKKFNDYNNGNPDAENLRATVERNDKLGKMLMAVGGACIIPAIVHQIKIGKLKKQVQFGFMPVNRGFAGSVCFRF